MRKFTPLVLVIVSLGLINVTACGSSDKHPITANPAVGSKVGVVSHGKSIDEDLTGPGLAYTCVPDLDPIKVEFMDTVNYNGIDIKFESKDFEFSDPSDPSIDQESATLRFSGDLSQFSSKAVSLIVQTFNSWTDKAKKTHYLNTDMSVVNLTPEMVNSGVKLKTSNFDAGGYISTITICAKR